jgi:hypothetical protein
MQLGPVELGDYHEWARETPVLDAVGSIVGVASVIVGGHAAAFFAAAVRDRNTGMAVDMLPYFAIIGAANGTVGAVRRWRRHHG